MLHIWRQPCVKLAEHDDLVLNGCVVTICVASAGTGASAVSDRGSNGRRRTRQLGRGVQDVHGGCRVMSQAGEILNSLSVSTDTHTYLLTYCLHMQLV